MRESSGATRFRRYTLGVLYGLAAMELVLLGIWLVREHSALGVVPTVVLALLFTVHAVLVGSLSEPGLRSYSGWGPRPYRLLGWLVLVTLLAQALLFTLLGTGTTTHGDLGAAAAWLVMFGSGPLLLALPLHQGCGVLLVQVLGTMGTMAALGVSAEKLWLTTLTALAGSAFVGFSVRCSGWSLQIVEELVAAREAQARLAVAEERLRFGRDVHDVLGRNLSVIALKSELAGQLALRGSTAAESEVSAAVAQMAEVQQLARDSQRELREVVRGYREADLHTELDGARGVLTAAGVECRVQDDGGGDLPPAARSALGWVVREGTTNVLRHSEAGRCVIRMRLDSSPNPTAVLIMENDGVRPTRRPGPSGSGLDGLRERLLPLDGTVHAETLPEGSFRLTARVPLRAPAQPSAAGPGEAAEPTGGNR